jgi:soluble cytochrome b562
MSLDRLLSSMAEALVAVMTQVPDQKPTVADELREIHTAATQAGVRELISWLDDALAVLDGAPVQSLGQTHQGVYAAYWNEVAQKLQQVD